MNNTSVLSLGSITYEKGLLTNLDRVNTMYEDDSITVIFAQEMAHTYSDVNTNSGPIVMGDRLNYIIDHRLESVDAFDAILPIVIGSHIFTELSRAWNLLF